MNLFVVLLRYVKPLSEVDMHLSEHRAWLRQGYREGTLLASGPRHPRTGGVLLLRARDAHGVFALLDHDPFRRAAVAEYDVIEFEASMHDPRLAWAFSAAPSAPSASPQAHQIANLGNGVQMHHVRRGRGLPLLLLHGWPGTWRDWARVLPLLEGCDAIVPDLRGFGDTVSPALPPETGHTPAVLADDLIRLLDRLQIERVTIAAHDIGATIAQHLARSMPDRVSALVLGNPAYPGIGARRFEPSAQKELWYQRFHDLPLAECLLDGKRDAVAAYLDYFHDHWAGRPGLLQAEERGKLLDVYARPGAFTASIQYYRARTRVRLAEVNAPQLGPITTPTTVLWGEADPVFPPTWADRLSEFFPRSRLVQLPGVGHFVPLEAPEAFAQAIRQSLESADSFTLI
jgi:pimeloyl-ACP methyl ester carboxylesterase/uncharacterized protein YciI